MTDLQRAENFLTNYGKDYLNFLRRIKSQCELARKELGPGILDTIYSRAISTGGTPDSVDEFKEAAKIAGKVRQKGQPVTFQSFLQLSDIVGLTIVVQYPDQIDKVVSTVEGALERANIKIEEREDHQRRNGYFATHLVCIGLEGVDTLRCEIQLKTLLHDAWSAKMHDLTYKPIGMLDPRLAALMASIAETLDSVENQSRLIRDMIKAGWNVEEKARRAARQTFLREPPADPEDSTEFQRLIELQKRIDGTSKIIESEPLTHPGIINLTREVNELCADASALRYGWMLAGRIASLRPSPDLVRFFEGHAISWLEVAPPLLAKGEIGDREISGIPMMFYVIGDLDRAIDWASELLAQPTVSLFSDERKNRIDFNRVTFMIEREYHIPTINQAVRQNLKREIENVLSRPALREIEGLQSSLLDTEGLMKITFAENTDQARDGIESCVAARALAAPEERYFADAYADLNLRLGWRRYFALEARQGAA